MDVDKNDKDEVGEVENCENENDKEEEGDENDDEEEEGDDDEEEEKADDDDMTCTFPIAVDFFSAPQPLLKPEDSPWEQIISNLSCQTDCF